ncbi:G-protein coupled receptor 4-like [Chanodichthys erythropterus]|uniref:G-protein coupled receptor 4-like n=1 Tax=Chanodichthys erythropterus TaxID=933992 RepID=UPI00351EFEBF
MNNSSVNFTTFGEPANSTTQFFGLSNILDIFSFMFGLPTHSYVIWLIITGTESGVASGFFNLNLSVCELGNSMNSLLSLFETWIQIKTLTNFLIGLGITGRPVFQCLICVERYMAVVHPVTFLKFKPLRYRVICCTVVWIMSLGSCLFCLFTIGLFFYIYTLFFSVPFLLFLSIQLFCLVAVLRALKQSGPGERGRLRGREEENHMKKRAFYLILITTVSMGFTYVPFIVSGLRFLFLDKTSAALEKILSQGTEDAGEHKNDSASWYK